MNLRASVLGNQGKRWMVVYTRSNWEKKADTQLKARGLESFCPMVRSVRKWSDRKKTVEIPLFNSYLFVNVDPREQLSVLQTTGIINYVQDFGKPAVISENDIQRIRTLVETYDDIESTSIKALCPGDKVSFTNGILSELKGEVLEIRGKKVLLLMKQLDCALIAKIKVDSNALFVE